MTPPDMESPFEIGMRGMTAAAVITAILAVLLFLTDSGVVNW